MTTTATFAVMTKNRHFGRRHEDDRGYLRMIGCVGARGDAVVVTVSAASGQTGAAGVGS